MLSCAAAVWEDLERHGILETLLHPPPEDSDDGSGSSGSSDEVENDSSRRSSAASVGGGLEVKSDDTRSLEVFALACHSALVTHDMLSYA